jgi:transcriptional regulator with XRE-family HTH domain
VLVFAAASIQPGRDDARGHEAVPAWATHENRRRAGKARGDLKLSAPMGKTKDSHKDKGHDAGKPAKPRRKPARAPRREDPTQPPTDSAPLAMLASLAAMTGDAAGGAIRFVLDTTGDPLGLKPLFSGPAHPGRLAREAGKYVRELREVAGLTVTDLARAMELRDSSYLEAVEAGTATLSFELILRLASIVARNDPLPAILRLTRTSNPMLAKLLDDWGAGRLPLQLERERAFVNILRGHDLARDLSDEAFERVLDFTRSAFEAGVGLARTFDGSED